MEQLFHQSGLVVATATEETEQRLSIPSTGCFLASFALGDKAVAAARIAVLPPSTRKLIEKAKRYTEGTAVRIEVHDAKDAKDVKTLAKIKLEN